MNFDIRLRMNNAFLPTVHSLFKYFKECIFDWILRFLMCLSLREEKDFFSMAHTVCTAMTRFSAVALLKQYKNHATLDPFFGMGKCSWGLLFIGNIQFNNSSILKSIISKWVLQKNWFSKMFAIYEIKWSIFFKINFSANTFTDYRF